MWHAVGLSTVVPRADFDAGRAAVAVTQSRHASFRITGQDAREVQTAAVIHAGTAQPAVARSAPCAALYTDFDYAPWPPRRH